MQMVLGVFNNKHDINDAISQFESHDFNTKDLAILMADTREAKVLSGGFLGTVLGLTGIAETISAVDIGELSGCLIEALTNLGVSDSDASVYEKAISMGGIILIVPTGKDETVEVKDIMRYNSAHQIRIVENTDTKDRNFRHEPFFPTAYFNQIKKPKSTTIGTLSKKNEAKLRRASRRKM